MGDFVIGQTEIEDAIVLHYRNRIPNTYPDYFITNFPEAALGHRDEPVVILVNTNGWEHAESDSQSPRTPARNLSVRILLMARGDSLDKMNELLNQAADIIEESSNPGEPGGTYGHDYPPYGLVRITKSIATSLSPKALDGEKGLFQTMEVVLSIMEVT